MACPNCTRLERAIYHLITDSPTGNREYQLAQASGLIPVSPEQAVYLDKVAIEGREILAQGAIKAKRKASPYAKRYGKAFKKVAKKYQKKSGGWMKNGFKRAQRDAHKIAGGKKR